MADIVIGIGTSHTPLFTLESKDWRYRAQADYENPALNLSDGRTVTYEQLLAEVGPRYQSEASPEVLMKRAAECEASLDHLQELLTAAAPDVVVIIGDDQGEMFDSENQPAIAVCYAEELTTSDAFGHDELPQWIRTMGTGYMMDENHSVRGAHEFGLKIVERLIETGVDVTTVANIRPRTDYGLGHAFGFVVKRLLRNRETRIVPVLLNTYYPPNVCTSARCVEIGKKLRHVIESIDDGSRVAVVASGGLSHFVVDERLDRGLLRAIEEHDHAALGSVPRTALNSGSSEILNWILAAGALESLAVAWKNYIPLYRTPAGSGVGAAFVAWLPAA